ncbi:MAG: PQQ-binding-like beta-propeller repeat protein [Methanomassiliicoccales archaeon]|nr:PQQ-binding-like beta-propeller repeat protein [Methanomassiliicoccales archaeon]
MKMKFIVPLALCLMMLIPVATPAMAAESNPKLAVLIDFGNGQVAWADVQTAPGMNAFNATAIAVVENGMIMNSTEFPWGVTVNWINGIGTNLSSGGYNFTTGEFWGFWIWNSTTAAWESSSKGADDIAAENATAVAWLYAPWGITPLATPDHRYPWRSFRGDNFNTGAQAVLTPNNITLKWSKDLHNGAINAPVVAANGFAYVITSGVLNSTTWVFETDSQVFCLYTSNGSVVWHRDIGSGYQGAAPLIYASTVIVSSADGLVYAFNAKTGADAWIAPFNTHSGNVYGSPSPIAYAGRIYVASGTGKLFCLTNDGTQIWNSTVATGIYSSSPAAKDGMVYIGAEDGKLHAFDSLFGPEIWNVSIGSKVRGSPLLMSSGIVVTYVNYSGLSPTTGGVTVVDYSGAISSYVQTGITPGSAAMTGSGIATANSYKMFLTTASGQYVWNASLGTSEAFPPSGPTAVKGTIFTTTDEAHSRLVAVSESGQVYWQYRLDPAEYAWASPSVSDGILYAASDNGLAYAFNLNTVAPLPSTDFSVAKHNLSATFSTPPSPGTLFSYAWSFGDGTHGTGTSAAHNYATEGTYTVVLTVSNQAGDKVNVTKSVTVQITTAPGAPGSFAATAGELKVTLSWTAPTNDGGTPIVSYKVYRAVLGGSPTLLATVSASNLTHVDTSGTAGTNYTYYVVAMNAEGTGPASATASATPQPAAVTDNSALYVLAIVVVAVVAIAVALVVLRGRKK